MKKKRKSKRTATKQKLNRRLAAYSSAAGIALLSVSDANAEIQHTTVPSASQTIVDGSLDINFTGAGVNFRITHDASPPNCGATVTSKGYVGIFAQTASAFFAAKDLGTYSSASALVSGASITPGAGGSWLRGEGNYTSANMAMRCGAPWSSGNFLGLSAPRFLGVKFSCDAGVCKGWIKVEELPSNASYVKIMEYAYQDDSGDINAGEVEPPNSPPTATNLSQTKNYNEGDSSVALDDIVVSDSDAGDIITATLTLSNPSAGSLTATSGNGETYDAGTGVWAIASSLANVNAALAAVAFEPAADNDVDASIATHVEDAAGEGPSDGTVSLDVTPSPDAPTATNMNQTKAYNEGDASVALDNIVVSDPDTGDVITATLTLSDPSAGSLTASSGNGETYTAGSGIWTITSDVSAVNAALAAVAFVPNADNDANATIATHVEDTVGAGPSNGEIALNVTPSPDAPTATSMNQTKAYNEGDASVALDDIVVSDLDTGETITATLTLSDPSAGALTATSGNAETYTAATGIWSITSDVSSVNAALADVAFVPNSDNDVNATVSTHVEDAAGTGPSDGAISLNVTPSPDAPTATNMNQAKAYNEGDAFVALDDIVVSDPDTGETITATLTLSDTSAGALTATSGNAETYTAATGIWTITSDVSSVNAALAAVAFVPNADNDLNATVSTHVEDAAGTGPSDGAISLNVTPSPDAPTATNMDQTKAYNEGDASVTLDDIVVSDPDTGDVVTATLTLSDPSAGSLTASSGNGESYTAVTGVWTITSDVSTVNAALAAVAFVPNADNDANATVSTHVEDAAGTGPSDGAISLNVTPSPDAPTATNMNQAKTYNEGDASVALDDIVVSDPDTGDTITATLTLSDPAAGALTATSGSGEAYTAATGVWTITSDPATVNAALAAVEFVPETDNDLNATVNTHVQDAAGTGPSDGVIALNVTASDDAPTATNMNQTKAYNEGDPSVALDDIVVSDPDSGETITATLTLSDPATGSLTATSGNGEAYTAATGVWTVTSDVSTVNAALAAVSFVPDADNEADATVATRVRDAMGTGPSDGTISLNVTPSNDVPTATNLNQTKAYTEGDASVALDDIVVSDPDTGDTIAATLTLSDPAVGSLSATSGNGETYTAATGVWTIASDPATVNAALAAVAFVPNADNDKNATIATHVQDAAGTGPADGAVSLNATPSPDAPTATNLNQTKAYTEGDASVALDDIVVSDPDTGDTITATLTLSDPATGSLTATSGNGETYTAATGVWTVSSDVSTVNAALAAVSFVPVADNDANATIATHVQDAAGLGPSDGVIALNVSAGNDAPTATNLNQTKNYTEGDPSVALDDIVVSDPDTGDTITATLTLSDPTVGSLSATSGNGETYTAATGVWNVTSDVSTVNAALAAVAFVPAAENDANAAIATHIQDAAGTGPADGIVNLNATPLNDVPTATNLNQAKNYTEGDASVALDDIVVSDPDSGDSITATLTLSDPAAGSLTAASGNGETYTAGTGVWTVTSDVSTVNAALAAVAFEPATDNDADATIATHIEDAAGAGPSDGVVSLTVAPSPDAPTATNMTQTKAYSEGDASVALDDIVVSDPDTGDAITATLTLSDPTVGSLSATSGNGETYTAATGVWTVTSDVATVNAALAAVAFEPTADNDADAAIATHIEDASGAGPSDGSIALTVAPVNDPPTDIELDNASVSENLPPGSPVGTLSTTDPDD